MPAAGESADVGQSRDARITMPLSFLTRCVSLGVSFYALMLADWCGVQVEGNP